MTKQIIVDIDDTGEVRIETTGFTGPVCLEESQFIKDLLGHETSRCLTPMFYQQGNVVKKQHINLCG
nr:DUF2997 domain-containing protein [Fundidesulfovibrio terrae]